MILILGMIMQDQVEVAGEEHDQENPVKTPKLKGRVL